LALDINTAKEADLDGLKGIGPAMSGAMLTERHKQPFKDWADLRRRVKGLGEKKAAQLSAEGLTVNGQPFEKRP
jgi:competence protein ComEA